MRSKQARQQFYSLLSSNLVDPKSRNKKWIFEDHPRVNDLSKESYPRVSLEFVGSPDDFTGFHSTNRNLSITRERAIINVWCYPDDAATYSGSIDDGTFKNAALRDRIASEIKSILQNKVDSLKSNGVTIIRGSITGPVDIDIIDNRGNTTHFHSEVRCDILYGNVEATT